MIGRPTVTNPDQRFEATLTPGDRKTTLPPEFGSTQGRWSVVGNVLDTIATEGTQHTDLGDRFHCNGAVTYRLKGGDVETTRARFELPLSVLPKCCLQQPWSAVF